MEPNTIKKFQKDDLDIKHKCIGCQRSSPVKNWNCECGTKWHMCILHSTNRALAGEPQIKKLKIQPPPELDHSTMEQKGLKPLGPFETILADDIRMELKRKRLETREEAHNGTFDLGHIRLHEVPLNFLGPILRKRFRQA